MPVTRNETGLGFEKCSSEGSPASVAAVPADVDDGGGEGGETLE